MPQTIQFEGQLHQFPDDFTEAEIQSALQSHAPAPQGKTVGGFVENTIDSAGKMASGLYQTVRHPVDTTRNVADVLAGLVNQGLLKTGLSTESDLTPEAQQALAKARGVEDVYKQRYGGISNIANTAYTDPVGVLGDASAVLGGAGAVLKGGATLADAANAGRISSGLLATGDAAATAGGLLNPVSMPGRVVRFVTSKASGPLAERMYTSALKPSNSLSPDQKTALANTGLSERIPVSNSGLAKSDALIDDLNSQIAGKIKSGAAAGDTIDPQAVAARVDQIRPTFQNQVNPAADLNALDASRNEFLSDHTITPKPSGLLGPTGQPLPVAASQSVPIPVDDAQAIKQGTYQQIRKSYGSLSNAQVEAQKALARGIKEELGAKYPQLADLNARDSQVIALNDALEKAVGRINNHQMFGIGTPLAAEGIKAATGSSGAAAIGAVARAIIDDPAIKSHIAIMLRNAPSGSPSRFNGLLNVGQRSNITGGLLAP